MHYSRHHVSVFFGNKHNGLHGPSKRGSPYEELRLIASLGHSLSELTNGSVKLPVVLLEQTHSTIVEVITTPLHCFARGARRVQGDALITTVPGSALAIFTADCVPLVISNTQHRVAAVIHAGWRGLRQGIIGATLEKMDALGIPRSSHEIIIGPAAQSCCYCVGDEFIAGIPSTHASGIQRREGTWYVDLCQYAREEFRTHGVVQDSVFVQGSCTICSPEFYSHRRDKTMFRQATVVALR